MGYKKEEEGRGGEGEGERTRKGRRKKGRRRGRRRRGGRGGVERKLKKLLRQAVRIFEAWDETSHPLMIALVVWVAESSLMKQ